jgi:hypothetical protein
MNYYMSVLRLISRNQTLIERITIKGGRLTTTFPDFRDGVVLRALASRQVGRSLEIRDFNNVDGSGIVDFVRGGADEWILALGGDPAYLASIAVCDTCRYVFTKVMPGQSLSEATPEELTDSISSLLADLQAMPNDHTLQVVAQVLPKGPYSVALLTVEPRLATPGNPEDYFAIEAVATWGLDPYFGVGHSPGTPYYRLLERDLGPVSYGGDYLGIALAAPMYPPTLARMHRREIVDTYRTRLRSRDQQPTAFAIGLVDDRGPAMWADPPPIFSRHLVVTLYLLDGHHKFLAASLEKAAIQVLAFFPREMGSLANPVRVDRGLEFLRLP